jgi:hypothetical protein
MFRPLGKTWWLLGLCGISNGMCAALNLLMVNPDSSVGLRRFALPGTVREMSLLALAAGVCAAAAGAWNFGRGKSWLLSLYGAALGVFGLIGISPLVRGPLSFRPVSLLFVAMAVSIGSFSLDAARGMGSGAPGRWFAGISGAVSIGFALSFLAVGFGRVRLAPDSYWIWMSSYFGFCAIFLLWMAGRARNEGVPHAGAGGLLPVGSPKHAH